MVHRLSLLLVLYVCGLASACQPLAAICDGCLRRSFAYQPRSRWGAVSTTTTTVAAPTTTTQRPVNPLACQNEALPCLNDHVYILNRRRLNWYKAREYCDSQNGHLVSILNEEESEFVANLVIEGRKKYGFLGFDFWIGGARTSNHRGFYWLDSSQWSFHKFYDKQPNDLHINNCVQIFDANYKKWANYDCAREFPSICKVASAQPTEAPTTTTEAAPTTTTELPTTTARPVCQNQTLPCLNNYVYILNPKQLSWHKAREYCNSKNGHLTSILSQEETDFVAKLTYESKRRRYPRLGNDIWIGGAKSGTRTFYWLDSSPWNYENFNGKQPNELRQNNCLQIFDAAYKKWANYDCSREYPSVCKVPV